MLCQDRGKVGFPPASGCRQGPPHPAALLPAPQAVVGTGNKPPRAGMGVPGAWHRLRGTVQGSSALGTPRAGCMRLPGGSGLPGGLDRPLPDTGVPGRCRGFIGGCWTRPLSCGGPGGLLSPLPALLRACLHGDGLCCYLGFALIGSSSRPNRGEDQPLPASPSSLRRAWGTPCVPRGSAELSASRQRIPGRRD